MIAALHYYTWYLLTQDLTASLLLLGVPTLVLVYWLTWRMQ